MRVGSGAGAYDAITLLQRAGIEVLSEHPAPELWARIPPAGWPMLEASGLAFEIVDPDLESTLASERVRVEGRRPIPTIDDKGFYDEFRDFDEVLLRLDLLAAAAPTLAAVIEIGESLEGRPIRGLRIARHADNPTVMINSCQHAREWLSVTSTIAIAEAWVDSASEAEHGVAVVDEALSERIDALLDSVNLVVFPVINPDGYVHTWEVDRLWRKNRREDFGIDLNRNFAVGWGGAGSSGDKKDNNYRGSKAFSEPETAALRDFMASEDKLVAHIDFHTYGQLVLYPWGFADVAAPDADALAPIAALVGDALLEANGEAYEVKQAAQFYPAAGNLPDWAYGELGTRSLTIELRPREAETNAAGFVPAPDQITPTGHEALLAVIELSTWAADAEPGQPGDDGEAPFEMPETGEDDFSDDEPGDAALDDSTITGASSSGSSGEPIGDTTDAPQTAEQPSDGCQCAAGRGRAPTPAAWLVLLVVATSAGARRRR